MIRVRLRAEAQVTRAGWRRQDVCGQSPCRSGVVFAILNLHTRRAKHFTLEIGECITMRYLHVPETVVVVLCVATCETLSVPKTHVFVWDIREIHAFDTFGHCRKVTVSVPRPL